MPITRGVSVVVVVGTACGMRTITAGGGAAVVVVVVLPRLAMIVPFVAADAAEPNSTSNTSAVTRSIVALATSVYE